MLELEAVKASRSHLVQRLLGEANFQILIERAVFLCEGEIITRSDVAIELPSDPEAESAGWLHGNTILPLHEVVRRYMHEVLEKAGGNKSQAARLLGITRKTLRERLERGVGL